MALNAFMHPRNIYKTPPDFKELVADFPEVRPYMTTDIAGKTRYDFKDPDALRVLTQTLLKKDFQLDVQIPADKLVPTLPNRLNYVLWLEDIANALKLPEDETVAGLDVGTGACAVYALLGSRRGWRMIGTERDADSLAAARQNVEKNGLQQQVEVLEADSTLLTGPLRAAGPVHFTLCNPPFFDSETPESETPVRRPPPPGAATGLLHEVSCPGGERAFVTRMIQESAALTDRCKVFTTMLGHKSSVRPMKKVAYDAGAKEAITTELCQGWTKRWAIGWTFEDGLNLRENVKPSKQAKKRAPVQCVVPRDMDGIQYNVSEVKQHVVEWLKELKLDVETGNCNKFYASYKVTAREDTWTHRRRRLREESRAAAAAAPTSDLEPSPASADLAGSPDPDPAAADTSAVSDTSDLSCLTDGSEPPVGKRSRSVSDDLAAADAGPASKRPCLETALGAVTLAERPSHPLLVFTLYVQVRGSDILLLLQLFKGELGSEGVNGVLIYLKRKLQERIAVETSSGGGSAGTAKAAAAATGPVSSATVTEGMGRVFSHLRTQMRQRLSLPAGEGTRTAGKLATEGAAGQPGADQGDAAAAANS